MKELKEMLKTVEKTDKGDLFLSIHAMSAKILNALNEAVEDPAVAVNMYCSYLLTVLAADGRLADEEFLTVEPLFKAFFGDDFDYEACKVMVKEADNKNVLSFMVKLVHSLPDEIAADLVFVTVAICAIDGKVSHKEKALIEKLVD